MAWPTKGRGEGLEGLWLKLLWLQGSCLINILINTTHWLTLGLFLHGLGTDRLIKVLVWFLQKLSKKKPSRERGRQRRRGEKRTNWEKYDISVCFIFFILVFTAGVLEHFCFHTVCANVMHSSYIEPIWASSQLNANDTQMSESTGNMGSMVTKCGNPGNQIHVCIGGFWLGCLGKNYPSWVYIVIY